MARKRTRHDRGSSSSSTTPPDPATPPRKRRTSAPAADTPPKISLSEKIRIVCARDVRTFPREETRYSVDPADHYLDLVTYPASIQDYDFRVFE